MPYQTRFQYFFQSGVIKVHDPNPNPKGVNIKAGGKKEPKGTPHVKFVIKDKKRPDSPRVETPEVVKVNCQFCFFI